MPSWWNWQTRSAQTRLSKDVLGSNPSEGTNCASHGSAAPGMARLRALRRRKAAHGTDTASE